MLTLLALGMTGGSVSIAKYTRNREAEEKRAKQDVDPATAALLAAKSLSLALPQPIAAHALSNITDPPSILVPVHTPAPPVPDFQVLANLIAATRKHALGRWGSQSLFVQEERGLDMGVWIGAVDAGSGKDGDNAWAKLVAGEVVEKLTDSNVEKKEVEELAAIISLPDTAASDASLQKALSPLSTYIAFSLPPKDGRQAFLLVGRHTGTGNWVAVGAATGGAEPAPEGKSSGAEDKRREEDNEATDRSLNDEKEKVEGQMNSAAVAQANEVPSTDAATKSENKNVTHDQPERKNNTEDVRGIGERRGRARGGHRRRHRRAQSNKEKT